MIKPSIEKYKKYINMHKRQMKIANKIASIKPQWKPKKCNLRQKDIFKEIKGVKIKKMLMTLVKQAPTFTAHRKNLDICYQPLNIIIIKNVFGLQFQFSNLGQYI